MCGVGGGGGVQVAGRKGGVMNTRAVRVVIVVQDTCQDLFVITVKYYDKIPKAFKLWSRHEIISETIKGK